MRRLRLLVCLPLFLSLCLAAQNLAPVITVDHGPNAAAQQAKPYVVMVSLDGFRYDYAKKYGAKHLLALGAQGAIAREGMIPSYPSLTFPNHYTLVTGLYPEHHGIVANNFYDPVRKQRYFDERPGHQQRWKLVRRDAAMGAGGKAGHAQRVLFLARLGGGN